MKWYDQTHRQICKFKTDTLSPVYFNVLFVILYFTILNKHKLVFLYLKGGGSNAKQECKEEEEDEGDGCVSHVVFFRVHSAAAPVVVCFNQKL